MKKLYTLLFTLLLATPLVAQDVGIYGLAAPRFMSTSQGHNMSVLVINNAASPATGFAIEVTIDGQTYTSNTYGGSLNENFFARMNLNNINLTNTGDYEVEVRIINNSGDTDPSNDVVTYSFSAFTDLVPRNDLVEIASGTWCGFCPYKDFEIQDVKQLNSNTLFITHHQGDPLQVTGDTFLSDYPGGTPRSTLNREFFTGSGFGNTMHPVRLERAMQAGYTAVGAPIGVDLSASRIGDTLTTEISLNAAADVAGETRIVAVLVEDAIPAVGNLEQRNYDNNDAGSSLFGLGDPMTNYNHNNVLRAYLNGTNGEVIGTDIVAGGDYTLTLETDLSQYNLLDYANASVIVFAYDQGSSLAERRIINARRLGVPDETPVSTSEAINAGLQFAAYPNPVNDRLTLAYFLPSNTQVDLQLSNNLGQLVYTYSAEETSGVRQHQLTTSDLPNGLYYLTFTTDGKQLTRKIVVE